MSHEDIKAVSDAYRSIYTSTTEYVEEETATEDQIDEVRRPNPNMVLKRASKLRAELWDVMDMLEDTAAQVGNPIAERDMKRYSDEAQKTVSALMEMENQVRRGR